MLTKKPSRRFDSLTAALAQAVKAEQTAERAVEDAGDALLALDGRDPNEWGSAQHRLAVARSKAACAAEAVARLRRRCADAAESQASEEVVRVEANLEEAQRRVDAIADELRRARAEVALAEEALEAARFAASEARLPFLSPTDPVAQAHATRQRQEADVVSWAARSRGREDQVPPHLREQVLQVRAQLERRAREEHTASIEQARRDGTLVETKGAVTRVGRR
jgi:hypothetical protein